MLRSSIPGLRARARRECVPCKGAPGPSAPSQGALNTEADCERTVRATPVRSDSLAMPVVAVGFQSTIRGLLGRAMIDPAQFPLLYPCTARALSVQAVRAPPCP